MHEHEGARPRARSPFAAAFLSLIFPGLGQLYAGAPMRALAFAAAPILFIALVAGVALRLDRIELFVTDGGPAGLGFIRGSKRVDPGEWFFKAHFYQDPVCPGSLGLESFLQLLKVVAAQRWGCQVGCVFETMALGERHTWNYRGQIIPDNDQVIVEAVITAVDDERKLLRANGFLAVDGKVIYQMKDFSLRYRPQV